MNLSVGALGGMTAIPFGGMMEVFMEAFGLPLWLAVPIAIAICVLGFALNGLLPAHTGINGFTITRSAWTRSSRRRAVGCTRRSFRSEPNGRD
jgi:ribose/xylose/arabinose/galactoside ABC-type transport system permease subunit